MTDSKIPAHCRATTICLDLKKTQDDFNRTLMEMQVQAWKGSVAHIDFNSLGVNMNHSLSEILKHAEHIRNHLVAEFKTTTKKRPSTCQTPSPKKPALLHPSPSLTPSPRKPILVPMRKPSPLHYTTQGDHIKKTTQPPAKHTDQSPWGDNDDDKDDLILSQASIDQVILSMSQEDKKDKASVKDTKHDENTNNSSKASEVKNHDNGDKSKGHDNGNDKSKDHDDGNINSKDHDNGSKKSKDHDNGDDK